MSHTHGVHDTDARFVINPVTRQIKNESSKKTTLIQFDHNSERFTFEVPRHIEGHDMSLCNKVEIHYINVDAKTKQESRGVYLVDDLRVADDENAVVCSWLISGGATRLVGKLSFIVRYACVDGNIVKYAWNTAVAGVDVSTGIDASDAVVADYSDVLERWKAELFNAGYINAATMQQNISDLSAALNVERKRIDNIVALPNGSTTGDAELVDSRIDYMGFTHDSSGGAIRSQANALNMGIKRIRSDGYKTSKRNIVEILRVSKYSGNDTLSCVLQNDGSLILNGYTDATVSFLLHLDGGIVPDNEGNFYIRWNEQILPLDGKTTWGVSWYFADGTVTDTQYNVSNPFAPLSIEHIGRRVTMLKIVFGAGWTFNAKRLRLYTDFYGDSGFVGYEPRYLEKTALDGLKWCSVGDSITNNTGNTGEKWQKQVASALGMEYVICAEGGRTTGGFIQDDMYSRIPSDADIITVMGGTNDCGQSLQLANDTDEYFYNSGSYSGSIRSLIKNLQNDFPTAKIIFCNCLGARLNVAGESQDLPYKNSIGLTMTDYANKCSEVCQSMGIPCINLCGESGINFLNATSYFSDAVHPNADGYKVIANVYIRNFKRILG